MRSGEDSPGERDDLRLQPLARAKIGSLGTEGEAWLSRLAGVLAELEERWQLRLGRPLPGGSASYVVGAEQAGRGPVVVKVVIDDDGLDDQVATLRRADGRGYARLFAFDAERRALLLEALGPALSADAGSPESRLDLLADTLVLAWQTPPPDRPPLDKAGALSVVIRRWWEEQDRPCSAAVVRQALEYAERRRTDVGDPVVVHGDPHPGNLLRVRTARPGAETGYCFVDPDGFVADRSYDLGVAVRDWTGQLRGAESSRTLRSYCARLADRTGVDADAVWEWGFVERVSTGLYLKSFGADGLAGRFLASAESLV